MWIGRLHRIIVGAVVLSLAGWQVATAEETNTPPAWKIDGFRAALRDPHPDVLRAALQFGGTIELFRALDPRTAAEVAPVLVERLDDERWEVRYAAAQALGALGEHAKEQAPLLVERLDDAASDVRRAAAQALGALGEHAKEQAPLLGERLDDERWEVRRAAAQALGALGEHAKEQAPLLVERLDDERWEVRRAAAQALGALGEHAKEQAPLLVERLDDERWEVRRAAAQALGALGEHAKEQAPLLGERLDDPASDVRGAAAQALGALGEHAKEQAPLLGERLDDPDPEVRGAAAQALGALGEHAKEQAPLLGERLDDPDPEVRGAAAQALGALGEHAKEQAPLLGERLDDPDPDVRGAAAQALGALGEHAKEQAPLLGERLDDERWEVRYAAAQALGALGEHAKEQAPLLVERLDDPDPDVRRAAAQALGALGEHAKEQAPLLGERLDDERWEVRYAAAQALGALGEHAKEQAPLLGERLDDPDPEVRGAAAQALGALGEHAKEQAPLLGERLDDPDPEVRGAAAQALGALGEHAKEQAPLLVERLDDPDPEVRRAAAQALGALGPFGITMTPSIVVHLYRTRARAGELRFLAHLTGAGEKDVEDLLRWLAYPRGGAQLIEARENHKWARRSLALFDAVWPHTEPHPEVREDVAKSVARLAGHVTWQPRDLELLEANADNLRAINSTHAAEVENQILKVETERVGFWTIVTIAAHAGFWIALIFAYPYYRPVQAIFFWNRWVRRIAGLGYVGFLLAWVPFLRRRLFAPFKESLLADARLAEFREEDYFAQSWVEGPDGSEDPLTKIIATIRGQIILEGESGLGKSMFLRHLVRDYRGLVIFLRAVDCVDGVLEATQAKLHGPARDPVYLEKLIYAGAIDVVIDGLNEVSAGTRAGIVEFARRFFKGNLLMATQPLEWDPPPLAKIYTLRPLKDEQIETFLLGRFSAPSKSSPVSEEAFVTICRDYVRDSLRDSLPEQTREAARVVLSNPMDLSVVAQMLARQETPNLFELQQQQYRLMAEDYEHVHAGNRFPLKAFADRVYEMRLNDEPAFKEDEFANELATMAKPEHRMVVPYHLISAEAGALPRWTFRHDKIMDYFLVQAFLGVGNERPREHLGDARFRGAYLQLANILPVDAAEELERMLIDYAADTRDHTVSDDFVQLLRGRKAA